MIKNIINENLDQFGLPYGEGQRITPQNFVPTMPMRDPNYGIPAAADQMAFRPNTLYDSKIKNMYEMEKMGFPQQNLQDMKERDVEQFNKGKGPLSLPKDEYKGIKGYTAMAIDPNRMTDAYSGFFNQGDAVSRTNVQGMDYEMDPGAFTNPSIQPSQNMFQRFGGAMQDGIGSMRDFAINKGMSAENLLGSGAAYAAGLPGIVGSGAMSLLGKLGNMFEDRQLSGDGTIVDEYGRSYNASDLNKQNALGGYYTDPARSSRRRTARIANMQRREAEGKRISAKNLAKLQAQEALQEQARLEATRTLAAANRATYGTDQATGGYQSSFGGDSGFMGGSGTAAEMGSFRDGGLASMFVRRG